jgi:transposase
MRSQVPPALRRTGEGGTWAWDMQLSDHDLKQLDEERVRSLRAEDLCSLSLKLLADLKEARDRLHQSPDNSSRPPNSRAPWEKASGDEPAAVEPAVVDREGKQEAKAPHPDEQDTQGVERKESEPAEKPRGKPGKPKGAPGHGRSVELAVTAQQTHRTNSCALCGKPLPADAPQQAHNGRYELDLTAPSSGAPGLQLTHTRHISLTASARAGIGPVPSPVGAKRMQVERSRSANGTGSAPPW